MKLVMIVISLLISTLLLASCNQDNSEPAPQEAASQPAHTQEVKGGLELNEGNKWQVDDHTRNMFSRMAESFSNPDPFSLDAEGRKKTGADLMVLIGELIQGCSLQGPAHDHLHEFLTGYIPAVESLEKSGSVEDAKAVKHHLETYVKFFE